MSASDVHRPLDFVIPLPSVLMLFCCISGHVGLLRKVPFIIGDGNLGISPLFWVPFPMPMGLKYKVPPPPPPSNIPNVTPPKKLRQRLCVLPPLARPFLQITFPLPFKFCKSQMRLSSPIAIAPI
jgi:hypothetical protein